MHETLSASSSGHAGSVWSPWSPDDLYPKRVVDQLDLPPLFGSRQSTSTGNGRDPPESAFSTYYDPARLPSYVAQQTSASAVRDRALHKGARNIFDSAGRCNPMKPLPAVPPHENISKSPRSKKKSTKRPKKLDLVHLLPHSKPAQGHLLSPARISHSPSTLTDASDSVTPRTSAERSGSNFLKSIASIGRSSSASLRTPSLSSTGPSISKNSEEVFQPKTHVRRPPKGIQNWFDAYPTSDEGEEIEDDAPQPSRIELPAEGPPASVSSGITKQISDLSLMRASQSRSPSSSETEALASNRSTIRTWTTQTGNRSASSDRRDVQRGGQERVKAPGFAQTSTLSLTSSISGEFENRGMHQARDTAFGQSRPLDGSPAVLHVRPSQDLPNEQIVLSENHTNNALSSRDSLPSRTTTNSIATTLLSRSRDKRSPLRPSEHVRYKKDDRTGALRRLNGLSMDSQGTQSTSTTFQDIATRPPSTAAHIMAVTEEEKALLDMMRQKRAAMQQMSFTEGYQLALQREQVKQGGTTRSSVLTAINDDTVQRKQLSPPRPHITKARSEDEFRRRWSAIRKEDVDEDSKMQRFLGAEDFDSTLESAMPIELPSTKPQDEVLPATTYSSQQRQRVPSAPQAIDAGSRTKVKKDGVSPSHSRMQRQSQRTGSPPSPVVEEESRSFKLPRRSPAETKQRVLPPSGQIMVYSPSSSECDTDSITSTPTADSWEIHNDTPSQKRNRETLDLLSNSTTSPIGSGSSESPLSSIIAVATQGHKQAVLDASSARRTSVTPDTELSHQSTSQASDPRQARKRLPELRIDSSKDRRRSGLSISDASEEILAAWADLGGGSDVLIPRRRSRYGR